MSNVIKLPTLNELIGENELREKDNALMVLLNQEPPKSWIKIHPMTKSNYLPIERVEYLLSRIYVKYWREIKDVKIMANSVVVTVRLWVINPITNSEEWTEGIGAAPIQTNKGAGAMDWNQAKSDGVSKAAPAAASYAFKNAAKNFGKLFGKDLERDEDIDYNNLISDRWKSEKN